MKTTTEPATTDDDDFGATPTRRTRAERIRDALVKMRFDETLELSELLVLHHRALARYLHALLEESLSASRPHQGE